MSLRQKSMWTTWDEIHRIGGKTMSKWYSLMLTRDTSETMTVEVEAKDLEEAQEKVLDMHANGQLDGEDWEPDDHVGDRYFTNLYDYKD